MSRRFGRNQRRRLREELAKAQRAAYLAINDVRFAREQIAVATNRAIELSQQLETVQHAVGEHFIGLPPKHFVTLMEQLHGRDLERLRMSIYGAQATAAILQVQCVDNTLPGQFHFHARLAGGAVAYGISYGALRMTPIPVLARQIAAELAPALAREARTALNGQRNFYD